MPPKYAVILPACQEEPCIGEVLRELKSALDPSRFVMAVGVNASTDGTARISREHGALVAETDRRGYGHGCTTAVEFVQKTHPEIAAFIFFAADGANDPADIALLVAEFERGQDFVAGSRTTRRENWRVMSFQHVLANTILGLWCGLLSGKFFRDIGPLRIIRHSLYDAMQLRELTYGWTIEAQIRAAQLGARMKEIPVRERRRIAGAQKVSRVSWRHSLRIGAAIMAAGLRTRFRSARKTTK